MGNCENNESQMCVLDKQKKRFCNVTSMVVSVRDKNKSPTDTIAYDNLESERFVGIHAH